MAQSVWFHGVFAWKAWIARLQFRETRIPWTSFAQGRWLDLLVHVFYSSIQCALSMGESEHEVHIHIPLSPHPNSTGKTVRASLCWRCRSWRQAAIARELGRVETSSAARCRMMMDRMNKRRLFGGGVGILPSSSGGPRTRESEQRNGIRWVGDAGTGHYAHTHTDAGVSKKSSPSHPSTHSGS
ncbi:hypothetical protein LY78DRAFT_501532 [Colletotrichum sublineola]|nr:hypothetical protein LY78DRAFT_501532 [Colletotrichum sublineola]